MRFCFYGAVVRGRAARTAGAIRAIARVLAGLALITFANESASAAMPAGASTARITYRPAAVAECTTASTVHEVSTGLGSLPTLAAAALLPPLESALQIERDPETGSWGLASLARTVTPLLAEAAAVSRFADDLVEESLPGGGVMIHLRGRFQTLSVASRTARGGVHLGCAQSPLDLCEWLRHDAPVLDTTSWPVR